MKFSQALSTLQPGALAIPTGANGKLTFKLDLLAPANGFDHSNAHDAMGDVEATLHICRLLRDCAGEHWSNVLRFSQRAAALAFMDEETAFIVTECYFGLPYQFALTKIGLDADNPKTVLAFDLEADPAELAQLDDESLVKRLGRKIKPLRRIRTNASPILHEVGAFPSFHGLSPEELIARAERIRADPDLCARIAKAAERDGMEPSEHVESQIYDAFIGEADKERMLQFHAGDWSARAILVETFEDARLTELGRRLVFHHQPSALAADTREAMDSFFARRMTGHGYPEAPWTTLASSDAEALGLLKTCCDEDAAIVEALRAYIASQVERCGPHLT